MFGLGMGEILVILVVALLFLGPKQLPDAAKQIGKAIRELRKQTQNLQDTIENDEHIGGTVRELKSALRGDEVFTPVSKPVAPKTSPPEHEKPVAQNEVPSEAAAPPPPAETPSAPMSPTSPSPEPTHHG